MIFSRRLTSHSGPCVTRPVDAPNRGDAMGHGSAHFVGLVIRARKADVDGSAKTMGFSGASPYQRWVRVAQSGCSGAHPYQIELLALSPQLGVNRCLKYSPVAMSARGPATIRNLNRFDVLHTIRVHD